MFVFTHVSSSSDELSLDAVVWRASTTMIIPSLLFAKITDSLEVKTAGQSMITNAFSLRRFMIAFILVDDKISGDESTAGPLVRMGSLGSGFSFKAAKVRSTKLLL